MASFFQWSVLIATVGLFIGPLFSLLGGVSWDVLQELITTASFQRSLWNTLFTSLCGAALSVVFAMGFSRVFALYEWRHKRLMRLLLIFPYLIPNFIIASSYVIAWNPVTGLLNSVLPFPGGLYGWPGLIAVYAVVHMPLCFLVLEEKSRRLDPSWREAARLSGLPEWKLFFKIEFPLLLPSLVSCFLLSLGLNLSAFAIPAWIGSPAKIYPLTVKIYQALQLGDEEGMALATALSVVLFLISLPALGVHFWLGKREKRLQMVGGKSSRTQAGRLKVSAALVFFSIFTVYQALSWGLPMGGLALSTLVPPGCLQSSGAECLSQLSIEKFHYVLAVLPETPPALKGSLSLAGISSALILLCGLGLVVLFARAPGRRSAVGLLASIPLTTPGAVLALGLIRTLPSTFSGLLILAYFIKHFQIAYQTLLSGYQNLAPALGEGARMAGASPFRVWTQILFPLLKAEISGGFFLVWIPILGELTLSVFLVRPGISTLGTVLFDLQDYADQAAAGALSICLVVLILLSNSLAHRLSRGRLGY